MLALRKASDGQLADVPVQNSAASQTPSFARHSNDAARNVSAGQAVDEPLQVSATSQTPADARQVVLAARVVHVPTLPLTLQD